MKQSSVQQKQQCVHRYVDLQCVRTTIVMCKTMIYHIKFLWNGLYTNDVGKNSPFSINYIHSKKYINFRTTTTSIHANTTPTRTIQYLYDIGDGGSPKKISYTCCIMGHFNDHGHTQMHSIFSYDRSKNGCNNNWLHSNIYINNCTGLVSQCI